MAMTLRRLTGTRLLFGTAVIAAALTLAMRSGLTAVTPQAEQARVVPAPVLDQAAQSSTSATAVLAGGCFWGVQGVYQHTKGVLNAVSGYAGGGSGTAHYGMVSMGNTGHAEAVQITFDPRVVSLRAPAADLLFGGP